MARRRILLRIVQLRATAPTSETPAQKTGGRFYEVPPRRAQRRGKNDCLVTSVECARAPIPDVPLPPPSQGTRLSVSGVKPLSLLTFFAAAKKVSACPAQGRR